MEAISKAYGKFSKLINEIVRILCIIFFVIMVIDVLMSVVMRYILVKPMVWGEQLAIYCMIWVGFLASSIAFRKGAHMGLDIVVKAVPRKVQIAIQVFAHVLIITFLAVLTVWGFIHSYAVRLQISPVVFDLSMSWFYLALPVGGICMLVQEVEVIINGAEEDV